jgi:SAM-dependent methyltransferase
VDLAGAAAAAHWFDPPRFAAEVRRVVRPGGVLAVWTYHPARVSPPFDGLLHRYYYDFLKPWFAPETDHVDAAYETLALPGTPFPVPAFDLEVRWDFAQLRAFLSSFSGAQAYARERGEDPVETILAELVALWGDPASQHTLRWPLSLRAVRL